MLFSSVMLGKNWYLIHLRVRYIVLHLLSLWKTHVSVSLSGLICGNIPFCRTQLMFLFAGLHAC